MKTFSRRNFIKLGAVAAAGTFVAARSLNFSPVAIQPPQTGLPLPQLPLLPVTRGENRLVQAELVAQQGVAQVGGVAAKLRTYNGIMPGPLLRLREGDRVQLNFANALKEHTSLHLHGLQIAPAVDDPFRHGHMGDQKLFEFDVLPGNAGVHWYHPHAHGMVTPQLYSGLAGAVVIESETDKLPELQAAEEHVLLLKDMVMNGIEPETNFVNRNGWLLVNGAVQPVLNAKKGTLRLRIVNASTQRYFSLNLEGHQLHLIGTDGGFIEQPVAMNQIRLAPGERVDTLVQLEKPGNFRLRDGANTLLTVVAPERPNPTPLPGKLVTLEKVEAKQAAVMRQVNFNTAGLGNFAIDGKAFDMLRVDIRVKAGDTEIWELRNQLGAEHPFHLHTYPFQVLDRNGVPEPFTAWRDVVNLPARSTVRIAVPFRTFKGRTVYHCHITTHEDAGMMGVLEVA
jgi:FtsP/CotA-like multicopper oxidase with cupredoxin domain